MGRPKKAPQTKSTIRIDTALWNEVDVICARRHVSMREAVEEGLRLWKREKREEETGMLLPKRNLSPEEIADQLDFMRREFLALANTLASMEIGKPPATKTRKKAKEE